jgi:hypothetical protein
MPLTLFVDESCPKCSKPIRLTVIEPHPIRDDVALQNFECANCGGIVKTTVHSLKSNKSSAKRSASNGRAP